MSDIIDRLRNLFAMSDDRARETRDEAAAEIERLRRELAEAADALKRANDAERRLAEMTARAENGNSAMTDRERRLVEAVSIAVKYLDALDRGQVFRPDEPTSVWGHLRSALADYNAPTP